MKQTVNEHMQHTNPKYCDPTINFELVNEYYIEQWVDIYLWYPYCLSGPKKAFPWLHATHQSVLGCTQG